MRGQTFFSFLLSCFLFVPSAVRAQTFRGGISGTAIDTSGAAVISAPVTARDVDTGVVHETTTSSAGAFLFQELPLGKYSVTVEAPGFETVRVDGIVVSAGQIFDVPVKMNVAKTTITEVVSADALSLDVETTAVTATISPQTVQNLPINGRDYTQMFALTPGYSGYSGGQGFDGAINGARRNQVNWQIDGVDDNDFWHNEPAVNEGGAAGISGTQLPIDTMESFTMQTLSLPEAGRNSAGTINVTLKSGTNQYHGSAYYYNRNELFGVRNPFTPTKQKIRNYTAGGSLGTPIIKNKFFFFGSLENGTYELGNSSVGTEPSAAYQTLALAQLAKYNIAENNVTAAMLKTLWLPSALTGSATSNNYVSPDPTTGHSYNGSVKFDYTINTKNSLSFHWFEGEGTQTTPGSDQMKWYYSTVPTRAQNYALIWNNQITNSLSNQVLLGADYFFQGYGDANHNFNPISLGFNTGVPSVPGAPNITFGTGSFDPIGLTAPEHRNGTTGHVTDDFSWSLGAHQIRFGGEYRKGYVYEAYATSLLGTYNFSGTEGPWASDKTITDNNIKTLADFLAGYMNTSTALRGDQAREVFVNSFGLFIQDAWKIGPNATFNYGIRWDYAGAPYNQDKDLSIFTAAKGIVFQGASISKLYPAPWIDFSPRMGFTYKPSFLKNTVIRGGGGIYFDSPNMNVFLSQSVKNGGALGLQGNPAGPSPTFTLSNSNQMVVGGQLYEPLAADPSTVCTPSTPCGLYTVNQNFKNAPSVNYSLNIQQELAPGVIAQIGYVGNIGRKEILLRDINQAALNAAGSKVTTAQKQPTRPLYSQYPSYAAINSLDSVGDSNYNSLQATIKTQSWHRLSAMAYYVWSHALDDGTNYRSALPQDSTNIKADYATGTYDVTNTFRATFNYDVPGIRNTPHWLTGGYELHSIAAFYGGVPISIQSSSDNSGTGEGAQRAVQLISNPYSGANRSLSCANGSCTAYWINPVSFANAPNGTFNTSRRDQVREPGFEDFDLSVFKTGSVTERVKIQFRVEMFNILNHVNYAPFRATAGSTLGLINSTIGAYEGIPGIGPGEPFNTQFSMKILF